MSNFLYPSLLVENTFALRVIVCFRKSQTSEHCLIWKGRLSEEQGGREGGGRELPSAVFKLNKQMSNTELRERAADRVTIPGADQLVGIRWDGHLLFDHGALIGHEKRHRLPHLTDRREKSHGSGGNYKITSNLLK